MDKPHYKTPKILWQPTKEIIEKSGLKDFERFLEERYDLTFEDYHSLWEWSTDDIAIFWEAIWQYFDIIHHSPYRSVMSDDPMPYVRWFEGATLNYCEHIFRNKTDRHPAIIAKKEGSPPVEISWQTLEKKVASFAWWLCDQGIKKGDRVVAYLPNCLEATIAFLAVNSIGAIWSSCSPDFGADSVVERFRQIDPVLLIATNGYTYNGKKYPKLDVVADIQKALPGIKYTVMVSFLEDGPEGNNLHGHVIAWEECTWREDKPLTFEAVPFDHPIWVLFSSGTTGIPKAITHSHGGVLLEHLKYLTFQNDVHAGDRFFWYSTTGWMMWNFVQASLLVGATIVIYDGSPAYPDLNAMWKFSEEAGINHFGTSAAFLVACMKAGITPRSFDLSEMRSIGSTGSPLPPEAFDYVYRDIKKDVWLCSMAGGTDVCTAFVGSSPYLPVYEGEIQCRALGCSMFSFDDHGNPVIGEVGEMVITKPMPSMPVFFWGDKDYKRYLASYFEIYPGVWRHGDWLLITPRFSLVILGRSDATLNRHGVRIGTSEIYRGLHPVKEIKDGLIVNLEMEGGEHYMPLFVVMNEGYTLTDDLKKTIAKTLRQSFSPRHVPDDIIEVPDIPYTISGKKLEAPVKKILLGIDIQKAANKGSMRNPESLDFFVKYREKIKRI